MSGVSTLTVLGVIPLVGAALIGVVPRGRDALVKQLALLTSVVVLAVTIGMCAAFVPNGARFQFTEYSQVPDSPCSCSFPWHPARGANPFRT